MAWRAGRLSWRQLAGEISWSLFGFVAGMLVLVQALEDAGISRALAALLEIGGRGLAAAVASVATAAVAANLINNLPASLVLESAIGHAGSGGQSELLALGTLVGADLGPNLTVVGSLSTMLWLLSLRRRDLDVSALDYLRVGATVTPIMLLSSALVLWLTGR
jgi:arsenical pump membrane protein